MPPPPGFEEIQRQELSRLFGRLVGARLVVVPAVLALGAWAAFADPARWRRGALAAASAALLAFFALEAVRYRRRGLAPGSIPLNLGVGVVGQAVLSLATGGVESPLLPLAIPLAFVSGIFIAAPPLVALVAFQAAAVLALAALSQTAWAPALHLLAFGAAWDGPARAWTAAGVLAFAVVAGASLGRAIRAVFDGMVRKALSAQQESLRAHGERVQELSALSAEIAHELKNPLASVKGLAGLLAPGMTDPKAAERLGVLRREVDRMQSILDGFLNFSRPLVPLALGRVALGQLAREVAALHEGMAHERGVSVETRGEAACRCDPRKVKQVLINLVQNALEASPEGELVEIEVAERDGGAAVQILDRGRGLDRSLGESIFEPGVTTKVNGSGIGLTVARALARQHGGDLALQPRPGGGCVAELLLPASPAASEAA